MFQSQDAIPVSIADTIPEDKPTTEEAVKIPPIPSNAQTAINIACAVRDRIDGSSLYHDDFELVFKAAVQATFGRVNW